MNYPPVSVIIPTMNRESLLVETIKRLWINLSYAGAIKYVIGNDGNPGLEAFLLEAVGPVGLKIIEDGTRRGLGGNVNRCLQACETDIVLQTQDDYYLVQPLDLTEHVEKLLGDESAGWIRLRLTQGQNFTAEVKDRYWRVSWHSQGYYIASDQPHLKHWRRFHDRYGMYAEGLRVGDTENEFCWRTKGLGQEHSDWPGVLIPVNWPADSSWVHMGDDCSLKDAGF